MRNLVFVLLSLMLFSSCGEPAKPVRKKPNKQQTVQKPVVKKQDSLKVTKNTPSEQEGYKQEIMRLEQEIERLRATSKESVKSTYHPVRYEQVKEILALMYSMRVSQLKKEGLSDKILDDSYRKFYTVEYCDNRVLEELDKLAGVRNKGTAARIHIDYDKVFNEKSKGEDIVNFK